MVLMLQIHKFDRENLGRLKVLQQLWNQPPWCSQRVFQKVRHCPWHRLQRWATLGWELGRHIRSPISKIFFPLHIFRYYHIIIIIPHRTPRFPYSPLIYIYIKLYLNMYICIYIDTLGMNNEIMDEGKPPLINPTCEPCKVYFWGIQQ